MADKAGRLPLDKESAAVLKDQLVELREHPGFLFLQVRLESLLQQARESLEAEQLLVQVPKWQGQVESYKRVRGLIPEILREIENTDFGKGPDGRRSGSGTTD